MFRLGIPEASGKSRTIELQLGESLFILGANGTGKSSIVTRFFKDNPKNSKRISAHRQNWFENSYVSMTSRDRNSLDNQFLSWNQNDSARYIEHGASERARAAIFDLINAENIIARNVLAAHKSEQHDEAVSIACGATPIDDINELLRLSNLPIVLSIKDDESLVARKNGGAEFSTAQMSDGERNAMLIAADVLTAKPNTLIFIDEPERHLHRSIISPLLSHLFLKRKDCAFVISTHEPMLPIDNPQAKTLLIRSCTYNGANIASWDVDLLEANQDVDEEIKIEILGSRRKLLFVEGTESSLDKPLYSLIFPSASVIAKASCRDVEQVVSGVRSSQTVHWVNAFGIVDNDRRDDNDINKLKAKGVYALAVYSVESIYYHPTLQAAVVAGNAEKLAAAKSAALKSIEQQKIYLAERVAEKAVRRQVFRMLPKKGQVKEAAPEINLNINVASFVEGEKQNIEAALKSADLSVLIGRYPVRGTSALYSIATSLGFSDNGEYEDAVRKLLLNDEKSLEFVRGLFGTLYADIESPQAASPVQRVANALK